MALFFALCGKESHSPTHMMDEEVITPEGEEVVEATEAPAEEVAADMETGDEAAA